METARTDSSEYPHHGYAEQTSTNTTDVAGTQFLIQAIRRHAALVMVSAILLSVLGLAAGVRGGPDYTATASVLVHPLQGNPFTTEERGDDLTNLETEAQLVRTDAVLTDVGQQLDDAPGLDVLETQVSVEVPANTQVVDISYTTSTAEDAQQGAQAFAEAYLRYRSERATEANDGQLAALRAQSATAQEAFDAASDELANGDPDPAQTSYLEERISALAAQLSALDTEQSTLAATDLKPGNVIGPAELPEDPSGLPTWLFPLGGLAAGLLVGVTLAALRARTDARIHDAAQATHVGAPVWATLRHGQRLGAPVGDAPRPWPLPAAPHQSALDPHGYRQDLTDVGEPYREMRTRVVANLVGPPMVLGVATTAGADTCTPEALGLATALARAGFEVALLDTHGDLAPRFVDHSGIPGLTELLAHRGELATMIVPLEPTLGVLPFGRFDPRTRDRLLSHHMRQAMDSLRTRCDYLILIGGRADSADGQVLATLADMTVLVVAQHHTTAAELSAAISSVERVGGTVAGSVLVEQDSAGAPRPGSAWSPRQLVRRGLARGATRRSYRGVSTGDGPPADTQHTTATPATRADRGPGTPQSVPGQAPAPGTPAPGTPAPGTQAPAPTQRPR